MDLVNVAHKIKELRLQQQLTIDQLAARSGLSKGYISRLENFRTGASLRALNLVSAALGVEMIDLFRSDKQRELMQHDSQEFFVLLEGEVDYMIGSADNSRRMVKGDTVYLEAQLPHGARLAPGCDYASALVIYH